MAIAVSIGPRIWGHDYAATDFDALNAHPSARHPFGTDGLGRDVLARVLVGGRISLSVAASSQVSVMLVALPLGMAAGLSGGWLDFALMRAIDVLMAVPDLLLIVLLIPVLTGAMGQAFTPQVLLRLNEATGGAIGVSIALAFPTWMILARLVRAQALSLRSQQFVEAAVSVGATTGWIMRRHILPNTTSLVIVWLTLAVPRAVLLEAGISFLGLGVQPPLPSWGTMIAEGVQSMRSTPHLLILPALLLGATVLALNLLGDALRDALDPLNSPRAG
jgi:ABC-type dipeptide/oligopeptide/nickel transport system permease subunit